VERGAFFLPNKPHDLCFGGVQNKVKVRESSLDTEIGFVVEHLAQNPWRGQLSIRLYHLHING
jgi:hypothetical protein